MRSARLLLVACTAIAAGALTGCEATSCRDDAACGSKGDRASIQHASAHGEKAAPDCLLSCDPDAAATLTPIRVEPLPAPEPVHAVAVATDTACGTESTCADVCAAQSGCDTRAVVCDRPPTADAQPSYAAGRSRGGCVTEFGREISADALPSYAVGQTCDSCTGPAPRADEDRSERTRHRHRQSRNSRLRTIG